MFSRNFPQFLKQLSLSSKHTTSFLRLKAIYMTLPLKALYDNKWATKTYNCIAILPPKLELSDICYENKSNIVSWKNQRANAFNSILMYGN